MRDLNRMLKAKRGLQAQLSIYLNPANPRAASTRLPKRLRPVYAFHSPTGFKRISEHDDPADRLAGVVDDNAVDEICERIVGLNLATLREISEVALAAAGYQARYARLEMRATPDELREALRRARTTAR